MNRMCTIFIFFFFSLSPISIHLLKWFNATSFEFLLSFHSVFLSCIFSISSFPFLFGFKQILLLLSHLLQLLIHCNIRPCHMIRHITRKNEWKKERKTLYSSLLCWCFKCIMCRHRNILQKPNSRMNVKSNGIICIYRCQKNQHTNERKTHITGIWANIALPFGNMY